MPCFRPRIFVSTIPKQPSEREVVDAIAFRNRPQVVSRLPCLYQPPGEVLSGATITTRKTVMDARDQAHAVTQPGDAGRESLCIFERPPTRTRIAGGSFVKEHRADDDPTLGVTSCAKLFLLRLPALVQI